MIRIKDDVYWVGVKDWEIRKFHGEELSTHHGSTYNSYLIKDSKTVLVDTVWTPFGEEYLDRLDSSVGLDNIDLLVIQHSEQDHAGSLPYLMERIPGVPIYCTRNGAAMIKKHFHREWDFRVVKTGDSLEIGKNRLVFLEMPMLHWPDSMATFVAGSNVLLSNDAFGQHYASPHLFNDQVDQGELYREAVKYYANILTPFSKLVKSKIREVSALNLSLEMIAPSHGVIWRDNPMQIIDRYEEWAGGYQENNVVIAYGTMWGATRTMAHAIAAGIENEGIGAKLFNAGRTDMNDLITEIFKARGIVVGSPTVNRVLLSEIAALLEYIMGLKFTGKTGLAFGSYGWSGESVGNIENRLRASGIRIVQDGIRAQYNPAPDDLAACQALGREFAKNL